MVAAKHARSDVVVDVVEAIASAEGKAAHELEYSLYRYVDPEVVRELAAMDNEDWELTFEVPGHEVTISGDGTIRVDEERGNVTTFSGA